MLKDLGPYFVYLLVIELKRVIDVAIPAESDENFRIRLNDAEGGIPYPSMLVTLGALGRLGAFDHDLGDNQLPTVARIAARPEALREQVLQIFNKLRARFVKLGALSRGRGHARWQCLLCLEQ